jgi:hypothetical protein
MYRTRRGKEKDGSAAGNGRDWLAAGRELGQEHSLARSVMAKRNTAHMLNKSSDGAKSLLDNTMPSHNIL